MDGLEISKRTPRVEGPTEMIRDFRNRFWEAVLFGIEKERDRAMIRDRVMRFSSSRDWGLSGEHADRDARALHAMLFDDETTPGKFQKKYGVTPGYVRSSFFSRVTQLVLKRVAIWLSSADCKRKIFWEDDGRQALSVREGSGETRGVSEREFWGIFERARVFLGRENEKQRRADIEGRRALAFVMRACDSVIVSCVDDFVQRGLLGKEDREEMMQAARESVMQDVIGFPDSFSASGASEGFSFEAFSRHIQESVQLKLIPFCEERNFENGAFCDTESSDEESSETFFREMFQEKFSRLSTEEIRDRLLMAFYGDIPGNNETRRRNAHIALLHFFGEDFATNGNPIPEVSMDEEVLAKRFHLQEKTVQEILSKVRKVLGDSFAGDEKYEKLLERHK